MRVGAGELAGGDEVERLELGVEDDVVERRLAHDGVGHAGGAPESEDLVLARAVQVGVDEAHVVADLGAGVGEVEERLRLAFADGRGGDADDDALPWRGLRKRRRLEVRAQHAVRLGVRRRRRRAVEREDLLRDDADDLDADVLLDVVHRLDGGVEVFDEERQDDAEEETGDDREHDVEREVRADGERGADDLGLVDDGDARGGEAQLDALAVVGVLEDGEVVLEDLQVVLGLVVFEDAAGGEFELLLAEAGELLVERLELRDGEVVVELAGGLDVVDALFDLGVDFGDDVALALDVGVGFADAVVAEEGAEGDLGGLLLGDEAVDGAVAGEDAEVAGEVLVGDLEYLLVAPAGLVLIITGGPGAEKTQGQVAGTGFGVLGTVWSPERCFRRVCCCYGSGIAQPQANDYGRALFEEIPSVHISCKFNSVFLR